MSPEERALLLAMNAKLSAILLALYQLSTDPALHAHTGEDMRKELRKAVEPEDA